MSPAIGTVVYAIGILGLFMLDRDGKAQTSKGLWISVAWLSIAASRMVSEWLNVAPLADSPDQYLEGSPLDRLVLTALLVAGVIVLVRRGQQVTKVLRANGPILLFFLYCAVSILWSDYPDVAFKRWTKALGDLVMVLVVLTDPDPSAAVRRLFARTSFLLVPLSVLLIKYYPDLGRGYLPWVWTPIYTGVTTGKNLLGIICLIFGLASAWRFLHEFREGRGARRAGPLIAHGALLAMVLWLFWQANSVTALACFLLTGSLIAVTSISGLARKPSAVHLLVAAMLFVSFSALFLNVGSGLVQDLGRESTLTGRTTLWNQLLRMTANPLFGTGFESFWLGERLHQLWSTYWWHPNEAHNGYLEVFLNLGWMGVALLAVVLVTGYRNVIGVFRRDPDAGRLRLAYFVAALTYSFTEAGFRMMNPVWIVFLMGITVVPVPSLPEGAQVTPQRCRADLPAARAHIYEEVA